jgi:nucleoid DNA-binding protein
LTRREILKSLLQFGLTESQAKKAIGTFLDVILQGLRNDKKVFIVGFGSWEWKSREARMVRNPKTGVKLCLESRKTLVFKPSRSLKIKLNFKNN